MDFLVPLFLGISLILQMLMLYWLAQAISELKGLRRAMSLLVQQGAARMSRALGTVRRSTGPGVEKPRTVKRDTQDIPRTGRQGPRLGRKVYGKEADGQ